MKRIAIVALMLVFAFGCAGTTAKVENTVPQNMQKTPVYTPLNAYEIGVILEAAIKSMEKQGCTPLFLNQGMGVIWARCTEGEKKVVRMYTLKPLIDAYIKSRDED